MNNKTNEWNEWWQDPVNRQLWVSVTEDIKQSKTKQNKTIQKKVVSFLFYAIFFIKSAKKKKKEKKGMEKNPREKVFINFCYVLP